MAMAITTCPKCGYNKGFDILNPKTLETSSIIAKVNTKCPDCGEEFSYNTLSNNGKDKRRRGHILV